MKTVFMTILKMLLIGAGVGGSIYLLDFFYRKIYVAAWRAGWLARIDFQDSGRYELMKKRNRELFLYCINDEEKNETVIEGKVDDLIAQ